jgi:hypothetical protein
MTKGKELAMAVIRQEENDTILGDRLCFQAPYLSTVAGCRISALETPENSRLPQSYKDALR